MRKKWIAVMLSLIMALYSASAAIPGGAATARAADNISKLLPGWTFYYSGLTAADYTADTAFAANGTQSLKLTNPSPKGANVYLTGYQALTVKPNTAYEWTVRVKGENVKSGGTWFGGGVSSWNVRQPVPAGTYDWQDLTVAYTTGPSETSFIFRVVTEDLAGAVWFDDIRMRENGEAVGLMYNPGFDYPVQPLLQEGFEFPVVWTSVTGTAGSIASEPFTSATEGQQAALFTYTPSPGASGWLNQVWNTGTVDLSRAKSVVLDVYATSQTTASKEPLVLKISGPGGTVIESQLPRLAANRWNTVQFDLSKASAAAKAQVNQINLYVKTTVAELEGRTAVAYGLDNLRIGALAQAGPVTAWPSAGAVPPGTGVSLSAATEGAQIFYTVDGSDPLQSETRQAYTAPIAVNQALEIKAYAVKEGVDPGPVAVFPFTLTEPALSLIPWESFRHSFGELTHAAAFNADITIDGQADDWASLTGIHLPSQRSLNTLTDYGGDSDLSADFYAAYDHDNLYWMAKVRDNVHFPLSGSSVWRGDSVQLAFGVDGSYGPEVGVSAIDGAAEVVFLRSGSGSLGAEAVTASVAQEGDITVYEVKMPWATISSGYPEDGLLPFSFLVNDNDGSGRRGYMEWMPDSIGSKKDPDAMATLYLAPTPAQDWTLWTDGPRKVTEASGSEYRVYAVNRGNEPKTFHLVSEYLGLSETLAVPAATVAVYKPEVVFHQGGTTLLDFRLTDQDGYTGQANLIVNVRYPAELTAALDGIASRLPVLEGLLAQNETAGHATDYERVNAEVIRQFIQYGKDDVVHGELDRAYYVIQMLEELYDEACGNLTDYLSGAKIAKAVPRYVTGPVSLDRYSFLGNTAVRGSGTTEERPVFFNGYGHFAQVRKDIPLFPELGANLIQVEVGPRHVIFNKEGFIDQFIVNRSNADADAVAETGTSHSGLRALRLTNRSPKQSGTYVNVYQKIAVKPDTLYTFKAWVKGENAQNVWFPGGDGWKQRTSFPTGTYDWRLVEADYRTGPAQTEYVFTILSENTGTVWVDDLSMTEQGTDSNLLLNPGFETVGATTEDRDYVISTTSVENDLLQVLDRAEANHVAVNVLLSPHYFPGWVLEKHPELKGGNTLPELPFVFDHPLAKRIIQDYLEAVIAVIGDHPALHSITLTNEPQYQAWKDVYNQAAWSQYLSGAYSGNVAELNRIYGTNYAAFGEVPMPNGVSPTPAGYDYAIFNNGLFSGWNEWMAGIIHAAAPQVRVHAKIMAHMDRSPQYGIDVERFSGFTDLSGNDNFNWITSGAASDREELAFYDLQASLAQVPIYNSEQHLIVDRDHIYGPQYGDHIRAALWQGAVHGRSASTIWIWERNYDKTASSNGSILHRPESVAAAGHTSQDLNRLSREVTALQNAESKVAIVYSMASLIYSPSSYRTLLNGYEALSYAGERVSFVSEQQMAVGKWADYKVLVVPGATHVSPDTLAALRDFQTSGGRVIVLGGDSLSKDTRSQPQSAALRSEVLGAAVLVAEEATAKELRTAFYPVLESTGLGRLVLTDTAAGQPVYGVEWRSAVYNGHTLLNVMNDSDQERVVAVSVGGLPVAAEAELIEGRAVNSPTLVLKPNTPYLFDLGILE